MHVISITVAFNPDPVRLAEQVVALRGQVDEIIIVDNGSVPAVERILAQPEIASLVGNAPHLDVVELHENGGAASGFNIGIDAARKKGAAFVLLLDHDSIPAADMVRQLLAGYQRAAAASAANTVAAVGPRIVDSRDKHEYPFIRFGWFRHQHLRCGGSEQGLIACDFLISSGSLVAISALDKIGRYDEALFIDSVDLEWCCRARTGQHSLYGVCDAELDHRLGDQRQVVWNRTMLVVHSPARTYYQTRNRILLYRRAYMPLKWKLKDMLRMAAKFLTLLLFVAPRLEHLRMTGLAIQDGLANRGGRLRERP